MWVDDASTPSRRRINMASRALWKLSYQSQTGPDQDIISLESFFPLTTNDQGSLSTRVWAWISRTDIPLNGWPDGNKLLHSCCSSFSSQLGIGFAPSQKRSHLSVSNHTGAVIASLWQGSIPFWGHHRRWILVKSVGSFQYYVRVKCRLDFATVGCAMIPYYCSFRVQVLRSA